MAARVADWSEKGEQAGSLALAEAVRAAQQGRVVVCYKVDADGRVSSCTQTTSSGSAALDNQTCAIVRANARYWPARDSAGVATPAVETTSVRWQLPTE